MKDGPFPGENADTGAANLIRIGEANDPNSYEVTGDRLVSLQNGLLQDSDLSAARTAGIGHSWGLTNITGSETLGAHYDNVVSLSGAWTPETWQPDPGTDYKDYSYNDLLQIGQSTGLVGDGNTPRAEGSGFEHDPYYEGPRPITIQTMDGPVTDFGAAMDNHNLVASDDLANRKLLLQLRKDLG
ncbi:hypothetical protein [Orlajensenia leifsoniae]|uniref:hypothetical protein n=1 Tax=Orlajensenia leifsoniae TaxID=2561933 RepID=UPI0010748C01|nr:hypothetical protein [Leifsonia flava]